MAVLTGTVPEVHFDHRAFDSEIGGHGTRVLWRRARYCPCLDKHTGHPEVGCPYCEDGVIWEKPGIELRVLAFSRTRNERYDSPGLWMNGTLWMTFPTGVLPGHYDRVELLDAYAVVTGERLVRGEKDKLGRSRERLKQHVVNLETVEAIVDGNLVGYTPGSHVSADQDGVVTWTSGVGPPDGVAYTVRYVSRPVYCLWSPQSRDEDGRPMPYRCLAQLLSFFRRLSQGEE